MKNDYPRRRNGNGILNVMGIGFALILTIGYLKSSGFRLTGPGLPGDPQVSMASMNSSMVSAPVSAPAKETEIILEPGRSADYDGRSYDNEAAYRSSTEKPKAAQGMRSMPKSGDWVKEFSSVAVSQAVSRGVPAALSLAVGLQHIEHGATILSWSDFVEKVVDPLALAKQRAGADVRSTYFKYSANSDLWIEGLEALGKYSGSELQATLRQYDLKSYDEQVRRAVVATSPAEEQTAAKANYVAEEITTYTRQEKASRPVAGKVAIGGNAADQIREKEEDAYFDEFVGREVAREIARKKLKSGQYIGEEDMDKLIRETNDETSEVVKHKLTFPGRKINRNHPEAEQMLDITKKENAAAREELYQQKLRENKLDSKSREKLKN